MKRLGVILLAFLAALPALIPTAPASQTADESHEYVHSDPENDLVLRPVFSPATPDAPLPASPFDFIDLSRFRIVQDDAELLAIELQVRDLSNWRSLASAFFATVYRFELDLPASGSTAWHYRFEARLPGLFPQATTGDVVAATTTFCIGTDMARCYGQQARAEAVLSQDVIRIWIPKLSFLGELKGGMGNFGTKPEGAPRLEIGIPMTITNVRASGDQLPLMVVDDFAPLPPYELRSPAGGTHIRVSIGNHTVVDPFQTTSQPVAPIQSLPNRTLAVARGGITVLPVEVRNLEASRRIIALSTELGDAGADWKVHLAPTIEVPAKEARLLSLFVEVPASEPHRTLVPFSVLATSLGFPNETSLARFDLHVAEPLTPERAVLHYHGGTVTSNGMPSSTYSTQWLNALPEDARANSEDAAMYTNTLWVETDTFLPKALGLDSAKPILATLQLSAIAPFEATVTVTIRADDVVLGTGSARASLGTSPEAFEIPVTFDPTLSRVASGRRLGVNVRAMGDLPGPWSMEPRQVFLTARGSQIAFPLVPDPAELALDMAPRLIGVYPKGEQDQFLNPGRTRIFHAVLVNEADATHTVGLRANASRDDWTIRFQPSDRYLVKPGEAVPVAIFVTARPGAAEGEQLRFEVRASPETAPDGGGFARFVATAIRAVDIPDDAPQYRADPEALDNVVAPPPAKASAGSALLAALLAVLLVLWRRR